MTGRAHVARRAASPAVLAVAMALSPAVHADDSYAPGGYLGASVGRTSFDLEACAGGFACSDSATGLRLFTGAWVGRHYGLEFGYTRFGSVSRNGGDTKAQALTATFLLGAPLHDTFTVYGKAGTAYAFTKVDASPASGARTGSDRGLGWSVGAGAQMDFHPNLALRLDWDLYRIGFAGQSRNVSFLSAGLLYKF